MKQIPVTEHEHQKAVIKWANDMVALKKYPMLRWLYACPNGGDRHRAVAAKLKAEGVKPGVPDLCLPYPTKRVPVSWVGAGAFRCAGLYIEMKSKDTRGKLSPIQEEWLDYLGSVGYRVAIAWTANEAIEIIEEYLNGD